MKLISKILLLVFVVIPFMLMAQTEKLFNAIHFDESLTTVREKVTQIAKTNTSIRIDHPTFPLAKYKEEHLVCAGVKTENGIIENVVFTFADDKLVYVEAKGNAVKSLITPRKDSVKTYLDYKVYPADLVFAHIKKDRVWMLTKEAVHVNLFTWENPYLTSANITKPAYNASASVPDFIKMGGHIDELTPILKAKSNFTTTEQLDGSDPNAQIQINCFGVEYAGFPRKIEARFGDNKLNTVWILTAKGEEERIRKKLTAFYGNAIYKNEDWEVFNDWQVFLRKDKPEVLLLTEALGKFYKKEYFKQ